MATLDVWKNRFEIEIQLFKKSQKAVIFRGNAELAQELAGKNILLN